MCLLQDGQTVTAISHLFLIKQITPNSSQGASNQLAGKSDAIGLFGAGFCLLMSIIGISMTARERGVLKPMLWHARNHVNFSAVIFLLSDQVAEESHIEFVEIKAGKIVQNHRLIYHAQNL